MKRQCWSIASRKRDSVIIIDRVCFGSPSGCNYRTIHTHLTHLMHTHTHTHTHTDWPLILDLWPDLLLMRSHTHFLFKMLLSVIFFLSLALSLGLSLCHSPSLPLSFSRSLSVSLSIQEVYLQNISSLLLSLFIPPLDSDGKWCHHF